MDKCYTNGDFKKYFKQNMNTIGLDVTDSLFETQGKALETLTAIGVALQTLGAGATIAEIVGATVGLEKLMVIAGAKASYYLGGATGSLLVATKRSLTCGRGILDIFVFMDKNDLKFEGRDTFFLSNPEILDTNHRNRKIFRVKATS